MMVIIVAGLLYFREDRSVLGVTSALYTIPGILFGLFTAGLLHNTSHNNIGNLKLNRWVGEFCGWWVLYGFRNFVLVHYLHHIYSDEEHDPVNPEGMSFFVFVTAPMRYMIKKAKGWLRETHGHHPDYEKILNTQTVIFHLILILRLAFWYLLLGKELFFFFYIPGYLSNIIIFAHINYICHKELDDGTIEIMNYNHNLYYRFANMMTFGGYFHKNHHINPRMFDPRKLKLDQAL
jgi:fatty-acid desaturase